MTILHKEDLEKLIDIGVTEKDIAQSLGRSAGSVQYWLRKYGLRTDSKHIIGVACKYCGSLKNNRYICTQCRVKKHRIKTKLCIIKYLGG